MAATDSTDGQNDAIVADHFAMLADDIAGRPYGKAAHNRALQARIGRSHGSIAFKHRNISAALQGLGQQGCVDLGRDIAPVHAPASVAGRGRRHSTVGAGRCRRRGASRILARRVRSHRSQTTHLGFLSLKSAHDPVG